MVASLNAINPGTPPETKVRILPLNIDFITVIQQKLPHLFQTFSTLTKVVNQVIANVNVRTLFHHVILIDRTIPADNVYAHLPMRIAGKTLVVYGTLRYPINSDFAIQINCNAPSFVGVLMSFVIPKATKVTDVVKKSQLILAELDDLAVLSFDIKAGDNQLQPGIVAITLEWTQ